MQEPADGRMLSRTTASNSRFGLGKGAVVFNAKSASDTDAQMRCVISLVCSYRRLASQIPWNGRGVIGEGRKGLLPSRLRDGISRRHTCVVGESGSGSRKFTVLKKARSGRADPISKGGADARGGRSSFASLSAEQKQGRGWPQTADIRSPVNWGRGDTLLPDLTPRPRLVPAARKFLTHPA